MVTSKQTSLDRRRAVCNETSDTDYLKPFSHCHSKYPAKHVQLRMILREAIGSCLHHLPKEQRGLRNGRLHAELGWGGGGGSSSAGGVYASCFLFWFGSFGTDSQDLLTTSCQEFNIADGRRGGSALFRCWATTFQCSHSLPRHDVELLFFMGDPRWHDVFLKCFPMSASVLKGLSSSFGRCAAKPCGGGGEAARPVGP